MSKHGESRLQLRIRKALEQRFVPSFWWKVHGGPFTPAGIPDLMGVVKGRMCALEVKRPEGIVSRVQTIQIERLSRAGAISGVVTTVDEAITIVQQGLDQGVYFDDPRLGGKFWSRIRLGLKLIGEQPCWLWTDEYGAVAKTYGHMTIDGLRVKAAEVAFNALRGPIPEGLILDHLCNTKPCVNPLHLKPATLQENSSRGNSRRTG